MNELVLKVSYGYIRLGVNHTVDSQRDAVRAYWLANLKTKGVMNGGEFIDGGDVSAKQHFLERKAGSALFARLKGGDHIVLSSLSRAFISLDDAVATVEALALRDVTLHICGFPHVDLMRTLKFWKEFNVDLFREKIKRTAPLTGPKMLPKIGWKVYAKGKKGQRLIPDTHDRECAALALKWKRDGYTLDQITKKFKDAVILTSRRRTWGRMRIYAAMNAYLAEGWNNHCLAVADKVMHPGPTKPVTQENAK